MTESPSPKRQRLSEPDETRSQPTTPMRASYHSPTKASLARSHPNLLSRSPGRDRTSASHARGRNLRMSLLANRTTSIDGEAAPSIQMLHSPKRGANNTPQAPVMIASDPREGFSAAIARAFTENRPRTSNSLRSPLTSRQPSASNPLHNDGRSPSPAKDAAQSFMRPRLVDRPNSSSSSTRQASSELELPPTPVQLGLEPPAERPKGLISSSSSPRASQSNSGKRRRKHRNKHNATSSPSKLREQVLGDEPQLLDSASTLQKALPAEVSESDIQQPAGQDDREELPEGVVAKRAELRGLQTELADFKADMRRLDLMVIKEEPDITPRTLKVLTAIWSTSRSESPDIVLPEMIAMSSNPIPHLTLFVPAGLRLTISSSTTKTGTGLRQIHIITVTTPAPYPPQLFGAVIEVHANPQTMQIESLQLVRWNGDSAVSHAALRKWVEARVASRVHRTDISGLIWGMGSYWEFCERRAKIWNALLSGKLSDEESRPGELVRWLSKQTVEMSVSDEMSIVLSWTARLDWAGSVEDSIAIACKGVPARAHQMVDTVFEGLRRRNGIIRAVEGVINVLQGA